MRSRSEKLEIFRSADIYPVISSEFCLDRSPFDIFTACAESGAKIIQLREKHKGDKFLYELAVKCRPVADRFGVLLMIDDRVDVALAAGADGVHLGQEDMPIRVARKLGPELFIGNSTHNVPEALAAEAAGADCINVGPIYPTQTKSVNCGAVGLNMIHEVTSRVSLPFTVMGGIKIHRFGELLRAGARVLAMVTEITTAPDAAAKVRELRQEYARCKQNG